MTTHPTTCKFCRVPIVLELDEEGLQYFKSMGIEIVKFAACNRCADLREEKRLITDRLSKLSGQLQLIRPKDLEPFKGVFCNWVNRYLRLISEWTGVHLEGDDTEQAADAILANPKNVYEILQRLWPREHAQRNLL